MMDLSVRFYPLARWARLSSHAVCGRGIAQPDWLRVALPDSQPRRLTPRPDTAPGQGARTGRHGRIDTTVLAVKASFAPIFTFHQHFVLHFTPFQLAPHTVPRIAHGPPVLSPPAARAL